MPVRVWKIFIWLLGAVGTSSVAFAQESAIELGKKNIALDEPFAITLIIREAQDQHTYSPFPDIAGMQKREVTTVNLKEGSTGKYTISQRITQYYLAAKTGKFTLPPFRMTVNGKVLRSPGATITVEAPAGPRQPIRGQPVVQRNHRHGKEVAEKKEDAFLALSTDRDTVFTGERLHADPGPVRGREQPGGNAVIRGRRPVAQAATRAEAGQLLGTGFQPPRVRNEPGDVNRKKYTQYKMYQAAFIPSCPTPCGCPPSLSGCSKYRAAGAKGGPARIRLRFSRSPAPCT
jgi:hypothetical protein